MAFVGDNSMRFRLLLSRKANRPLSSTNPQSAFNSPSSLMGEYPAGVFSAACLGKVAVGMRSMQADEQNRMCQ